MKLVMNDNTDNIVSVIFDKNFRAKVATDIKYYGIKRVESQLLLEGFNKDYVKTLIRSIMGKEGW